MKPFGYLVAIVTLLSSCVLRHRIEPSEKPLVIDLNVKIDHEIRVKIKDQNQDLLNLEEEVLKKAKKKK